EGTEQQGGGAVHRGLLRASCEPPASLLRASCEPPASLLRASCEPPASLLRASCEPPASLLRASCEPPARYFPPRERRTLTNSALKGSRGFDVAYTPTFSRRG